MRTRPVLALSVAAALALGSGCGQDDDIVDPEPVPVSFTLTYEAGSVPPPHHDEWKLVVRDGRGMIHYLPDYPGPGVPRYRARFPVDQAELEDLSAEIRDRGLLRDDFDESAGGEQPVGGASISAVVEYGGKRYRVPAFAENGESPLAPLLGSFRELVPDRIWREFQQRRARYALRRHGERP